MPPPAAGEATIYIYRVGSMLGALALPTIFVNGDDLATLKNSQYTRTEVPQGTAAVAAAQTQYIIRYSTVAAAAAHPEYLTDGVRFYDSKGVPVIIPGVSRVQRTLPGCEAMDFSGLWADLVHRWILGEQGGQPPLNPADTMRCQDSLRKAEAAMRAAYADPGPTGEVIQLCDLRYIGSGANAYETWTAGYDSADAHSCESDYSEALYLLTTDSVPAGPGPTRIAIPVEAGKAYYIRWSVSSRGGAIKLVDETAGAKEVRKLHLSSAIDVTHRP
jgi:hypothetical protein